MEYGGFLWKALAGSSFTVVVAPDRGLQNRVLESQKRVPRRRMSTKSSWDVEERRV